MEERDKNKRPIYRDTNLQIIFCITLMAVMGVNSITPAFPKMVQELRISPQEIGLLISVFTLPMVVATLAFGVLADRYGRKKIIFPSLMLYGIAGGACAFTRDFNLLLILRFFQGIGTAALFPLAAAILGDIYSGKERTAAMGYNSSIINVGHATFPAIGGALAMLEWNYPFALSFMAVPIGLFVLFSLKNPEPKSEQNFKEYLSNAWQSIKNTQVIGIFISAASTFIFFYGSYLTYFPLLMGNSFGSTSLVIGLIMSGMSITAAVVSSQLGKLARTIPERYLLKLAFVLYALALVTIPLIPNIWLIFIPTILFGIAHGINLPSSYALLIGLSPAKYRGAFLSVDEMVVRLGQALGPLIMGVVFGLWGIVATFYAGAIVSIAVLLVLAVMVK